MRIGIDARFFGAEAKGLGRYTQQLITHLELLDTNNEYVVFMRQETWDAWQPKTARWRKVLADFRWYSFAEQIGMPRIMRKNPCDLYHYPHFNVPLFAPRPFIVTIHDLILSRFPSIKATTLGRHTYRIKNLAYTITIRRALHRSSHIITISQYTKNDIITVYRISHDSISVVYEGVIPFTRLPYTMIRSAADRMHISRPYFLYVGNAYPHKNLEKLCEAFAIFQRSHHEYHLVLVGQYDFFYSRLKNFVLQKGIPNIIFPGFVADEDLAALYQGALSYVFPSKYEGFGLPPLEAMSMGLPVASSSTSCLPEILGNAATYFSPNDRHDIVTALERISSQPDLRAKLIEKGMSHVKKFSWRSMAESTLSLYEQTYAKIR